MITEELRNRGYHAVALAACRLILEEHRELRRLLALGLMQTYAPSRCQGSGSALLRALIGRTKVALVDHLLKEEAALLALFDSYAPGSARRMRLLFDKHARQRREIEALHALSETRDFAAVADRFDGFARALLLDIAEEERAFALSMSAFDDRGRSSADAQVPTASTACGGSRGTTRVARVTG
jgi:hypothetical protein